MAWVLSALGVLVIVLVLRDVFHTLWHPSGHGRISRAVMIAVWRLSRRSSRTALLAGPVAMVTVILTWGSAVVLGGALLYLPHLPHGFHYAAGLNPADRSPPLDALYLSLVDVTTLGLGDIVPAEGWLRVVVPLQALVGFSLLTAAVSWILQIYPALRRRRILALRLTALTHAGAARSIGDLPSPAAAQLLSDLATGVVGMQVDLSQYAETYYFRDSDRDMALAHVLSYASDLAQAGLSSPRPDVRLAAGLLAFALDELAGVLDLKFLHVGGDTRTVFAAFAVDHLQCPP